MNFPHVKRKSILWPKVETPADLVAMWLLLGQPRRPRNCSRNTCLLAKPCQVRFTPCPKYSRQFCKAAIILLGLFPFPHFTDGETEAQVDSNVTVARAHSQQVANVNLNQVCIQIACSFHHVPLPLSRGDPENVNSLNNSLYLIGYSHRPVYFV